MKRALIVATVIGFVQAFLADDIDTLQRAGFEVHIAANLSEAREGVLEGLRARGCVLHAVPLTRSPFSLRLPRGARMLRRILRADHFDLVHCHTPVGGVVARHAAARLRRRGTRVIYTAHGFHFYTGAPRINWLTFYPIEKHYARKTDTLVTINRADYELARKKLGAGRVRYLPGVGLDTARPPADAGKRALARAALGVGPEDVLILSVGELNENKNHAEIVRALPLLDARARYFAAGEGAREAALKALAAELGVLDRFRLLGYRRDIPELIAAADVFVCPSFREGLSVAVMEAMAGGLPVVASRIRGNEDLVDDGRGGSLCTPGDTADWARALTQLTRDADFRGRAGAYNRGKIAAFDRTVVRARMREIYAETLGPLWPAESESGA